MVSCHGLSFKTVLDAEVALNNRPLSYIKDDVQLPILMPNKFLFDQCNVLPELKHHHQESSDLRKRAKHLRQCKEMVWQRWTGEYLRGFQERHRLKQNGKPVVLQVGEVVLIKSDQENHGKWRIGIVE